MRTTKPLAVLSPEDIVIVGVDPGPVPGVCRLRYCPPRKDGTRALTTDPMFFECSANALVILLRAILPSDVGLIIVSYESFNLSNRSAKVTAPKASAQTSRMCGQIETLPTVDPRIVIRHHPASQVMPWALPDRLERAGLEGLTRVRRHVYSAAKHALYSAVHDAGIPDPLSKRHKKTEVPA